MQRTAVYCIVLYALRSVLRYTILTLFYTYCVLLYLVVYSSSENVKPLTSRVIGLPRRREEQG